MDEQQLKLDLADRHRFLGDWCSNAGTAPYEDDDHEALERIGDALAMLVGTPYLEPLSCISRRLTTPLEALCVWDAIDTIARSSAALSAREARRQGATWQRIGDAVHVSKSAALQRYEPIAKQKRRDLSRARYASVVKRPRNSPGMEK
jgi:hypothetical protein